MFEVGAIVDLEYGGVTYVGEIVQLRQDLVRVQFPKVTIGQTELIARIVTVTRRKSDVVSHNGEVPSLQERMLQSLQEVAPAILGKRERTDA